MSDTNDIITIRALLDQLCDGQPLEPHDLRLLRGLLVDPTDAAYSALSTCDLDRLLEALASDDARLTSTEANTLFAAAWNPNGEAIDHRPTAHYPNNIMAINDDTYAAKATEDSSMLFKLHELQASPNPLPHHPSDRRQSNHPSSPTLPNRGVHARDDSSLLFNLRELQALNLAALEDASSPDTDPDPDDSSSGLIDIQTIAATRRRLAQHEAFNHGATTTHTDDHSTVIKLEQPLLTPAPLVVPTLPMGDHHRSNTPLLVAIVGLVSLVLILGALIAALLLSDTSHTPESTTTTAYSPTEALTTGPGGHKTAPADMGTADNAPANPPPKPSPEKESEGTVPGPSEPPLHAAHTQHEEKRETHAERRKAELEDAARINKRLAEQRKARRAAVEKAPNETLSKPTGQRKTDGIPTNVDNILNDITSGKGKTGSNTRAQTPETSPSRNEGLGRSVIKGGVNQYMGQIRKCSGSGQPGTVMVQFSIQPNGSVGSAAVTNGKRGTAEGNCVLAVVRRMRFPRFSGSAKTVNYPFRLR